MSLSRAYKPEHAPKVEINVVPLVDVALVLLIIFMVTATFMKAAGVRIQLPTSETARPVPEEKKELVIAVTAAGEFRWQGQRITDAQLAGVLAEKMQALGPDCRVLIQGDDRAAHGRVVRAMTLAQQAGFSRLVIAAKREREAP